MKLRECDLQVLKEFETGNRSYGRDFANCPGLMLRIVLTKLCSNDYPKKQIPKGLLGPSLVGLVSYGLGILLIVVFAWVIFGGF